MDEISSYSAEVLFAQRLAANEKKIRDRAIKSLRTWLSTKSKSNKGGFTETDLLKLWKGLHYCMWMSDKALIQEELSRSIASLTHCFSQNGNIAFLFMRIFFRTQAREFYNIDRWRLDKFMMMFRDFLHEMLIFLSNKGWRQKRIAAFNDVLTEELLDVSKCPQCPDGLRFHLVDIFLNELNSTGGKKLNAGQVTKLLEPFILVLQSMNNDILYRVVQKHIFRAIINNAILQAEKEELKEGDDDEESEEEDEDFCYDLKFDYGAIAERLFAVASDKKCVIRRRAQIYQLVTMFRDLAQGIIPVEDDISDNPDDDDIFGGMDLEKAERDLDRFDTKTSTAVDKTGKRREKMGKVLQSVEEELGLGHRGLPVVDLEDEMANFEDPEFDPADFDVPDELPSDFDDDDPEPLPVEVGKKRKLKDIKTEKPTKKLKKTKKLGKKDVSKLEKSDIVTEQVKSVKTKSQKNGLKRRKIDETGELHVSSESMNECTISHNNINDSLDIAVSSDTINKTLKQKLKQCVKSKLKTKIKHSTPELSTPSVKSRESAINPVKETARLTKGRESAINPVKETARLTKGQKKRLKKKQKQQANVRQNVELNNNSQSHSGGQNVELKNGTVSNGNVQKAEVSTSSQGLPDREVVIWCPSKKYEKKHGKKVNMLDNGGLLHVVSDKTKNASAISNGGPDAVVSRSDDGSNTMSTDERKPKKSPVLSLKVRDLKTPTSNGKRVVFDMSHNKSLNFTDSFQFSPELPFNPTRTPDQSILKPSSPWPAASDWIKHRKPNKTNVKKRKKKPSFLKFL